MSFAKKFVASLAFTFAVITFLWFSLKMSETTNSSPTPRSTIVSSVSANEPTVSVDHDDTLLIVRELGNLRKEMDEAIRLRDELHITRIEKQFALNQLADRNDELDHEKVKTEFERGNFDALYRQYEQLAKKKSESAPAAPTEVASATPVAPEVNITLVAPALVAAPVPSLDTKPESQITNTVFVPIPTPVTEKPKSKLGKVASFFGYNEPKDVGISLRHIGEATAGAYIGTTGIRRDLHRIRNDQKYYGEQTNSGIASLLYGQTNIWNQMNANHADVTQLVRSGFANQSRENTEIQNRITAMQMSLGRALTDTEARLAAQITQLNSQQIEMARQLGLISDQAAKSLEILRKMSACNPVTPFGPNRDCKP